MLPRIPEPGEPLESKSEERKRFIVRWLIIGVFLWTVASILYGIGDYIDLLVNGPVPLRPGYIPKAYRTSEAFLLEGIRTVIEPKSQPLKPLR